MRLALLQERHYFGNHLAARVHVLVALPATVQGARLLGGLLSGRGRLVGVGILLLGGELGGGLLGGDAVLQLLHAGVARVQLELGGDGDLVRGGS